MKFNKEKENLLEKLESLSLIKKVQVSDLLDRGVFFFPLISSRSVQQGDDQKGKTAMLNVGKFNYRSDTHRLGYKQILSSGFDKNGAVLWSPHQGGMLQTISENDLVTVFVEQDERLINKSLEELRLTA